ncbi:MAG TPA: phage holin family protein, partial [Ilumatobacteraceae bacterium]|nr:phage holin family protein [Ilumatobacteraceae bacterium]
MLVRRHVIEFAVTAVAFGFIAWVLPWISIRDWQTVLAAAAIVSILNAIVWPLVARWFSRLILWTAGLLGLVANGLVLLLTAEWLDGLTIDSWQAAVFASLLMTAIGIVVSTLLSIDDEE